MPIRNTSERDVQVLKFGELLFQAGHEKSSRFLRRKL